MKTMLTTFDRHIMRRFAMGILYLTGGLIVFFIVMHYVEFIDDFIDRGATMKQVFLTYYPSYIPEIIRLTAPLATFLSCVYLTGRLSQKLQLGALQTSGVSLYRLLVPYAIVAFFLSLFMLWFNGWVVPVTNQTVIEFEQKYLKGKQIQVDLNDIHRQNSPGNVITVGYYDRFGQVAHRVSLQQFDEQNRLISRIDATRLVWVDTSQHWRIDEGYLRKVNELTGEITRERLLHQDTVLTVLPRDLARTEREVESMTVPVAREYIESLKRAGVGNTGRSMVGYYSKFAYPFANLVVVLIGMPLASVRRRGGQAVQLALGLMVAFFYLAAMKLIEPFGYSGQFPPLLAAWTPHVLFFGLGVYLMLKTRK